MTGVLNPDVTGNYEAIGPYNDKPSYELDGNGWFIWIDLIGIWHISTVRGVEGANSWAKAGPPIEGIYSPQGTATGDATVAEI